MQCLRVYYLDLHLDGQILFVHAWHTSHPTYVHKSVLFIRNQSDLRKFLATLHCSCKRQQPNQLAEEAGAEREQMERKKDGTLEVGKKE